MKRSPQHAFEPEEIMAYLDGELEPQHAALLASHLEHCDECQAVAMQLRQVSERLLDFQVELAPAKTTEAVMSALAGSGAEIKAKAAQSGSQSGWSVFVHKLMPRTLLAWASALVGAVIIILAAVLIAPNQLTMHKAAYEVASNGAPVLSKSAPTADQTATFGQGPTPPPPPSAGPATPVLPAHVEGVVGGVPGGANSLQRQTEDGIEAPEFRGPMIVQTAAMTILATNYDQASRAVEQITTQHGGYVQELNADTRTGEARSLSGTLRVPDKQLEAFLADLRKLGHVEQETRNNQEITDQYVDLRARLKSARATEQRVLALLGTRTGKLSDVLEAERELARIRGEIESMDGQRTTMEHQVRYATVQVQLNEEYREQLNPGATSTSRRMQSSLVEGFRNLAGEVVSLLIFLFSYGPSILFWVALFGVPAWFAWRRFRRPKTP